MTARRATGSREQEFVAYLVRHFGIVATKELLSTFAGYTIPKRSIYLIHRTRQRALIAVALRLVSTDSILTKEIAERVGKEVGMSFKEVRYTWYTFKRKGKAQIDSGASTETATGQDALSR